LLVSSVHGSIFDFTAAAAGGFAAADVAGLETGAVPAAGDDPALGVALLSLDLQPAAIRISPNKTA